VAVLVCGLFGRTPTASFVTIKPFIAGKKVVTLVVAQIKFHMHAVDEAFCTVRYFSSSFS